MRLSSAFLLLATSAPLAFAVPKITAPAAGASITAGQPFPITWVDDGVAPALAALLTYQIFLFSGGDAAPTQLFTVVPSGAFTTGSTVQGLPITVSVGAPAPGKYFIGIQAVAQAGGTITTFSGRFTIAGMTGTFAPGVSTANAGVTGIAAPPEIKQLASNPTSAVLVPGAQTTDPLGWTIPYNLQTGEIKYAPMQPVPGTAITATNTAPLWPTSSVVLATTFLPIPTQYTTLTAPPATGVLSHPNTAAAASSPVDDMQRFLNRWKD